jgi:D-tyrosyl-tRNA(Tyr) deacylase
MHHVMRAVVQRVSRAAVRVDGATVGAIGPGLVVLLGVGQGDGDEGARFLADKIAALRIFVDAEGKMNRAVAEVGGEVLVISQFTLFGDARKGNRPSFTGAAPPAEADALYQRCCALLREKGLHVATGTFRAHMEVELVNDGPVTILLDSARLF